MEQLQESKSEGGKNEGEKVKGAKDAKNSGGVIRGLLGKGTLLVAGLLGAGGAVGCGGARPEAPEPLLDVRVIMVAPEKAARPPEGGMGGEAKGEKKEEKKEETIQTKQVAVIGQRHVEVDGRYYLKTKDWDKETVWVLHKGYRLPALDTPPEISAEFKGKNMKYAGRYYSEAEDPAAWERGRKAEKSYPPKTEITPPTPSFPKPADEKISPLGSNEITRVLYGSAAVNGNRLTVIDTKGMYHEFSFCGGMMPPIPPGHYPIQGVLHAVPGEEKGHRNIFLAVGWSAIPWPRGVVRIPPTTWQWLETGPVKK